MNQFRVAALTTVLAAAATVFLPAQSANPAFRLTTIEGHVFVGDQPVSSPVPAAVSDPSVVRTADGRAVIAIRGGTVSLDRDSAVRVIGNAPYNFNKVEVLSGTAILKGSDNWGEVVCQDRVRVSKAGVFRIDVEPAADPIDTKCTFKVYDGAAAVQLATVTTVLTPGQAMDLNKHCGDMIPSRSFDARALDRFDRWASAR